MKTLLMQNCLRVLGDKKHANKMYYGKWFKPRSLSRLCGLIVRVRVVPRRTVVRDIGDKCITEGVEMDWKS